MDPEISKISENKAAAGVLSVGLAWCFLFFSKCDRILCYFYEFDRAICEMPLKTLKNTQKITGKIDMSFANYYFHSFSYFFVFSPDIGGFSQGSPGFSRSQ